MGYLIDKLEQFVEQRHSVSFSAECARELYWEINRDQNEIRRANDRIGSVLDKIAKIAHHGGLTNMSESAALIAIRELTIPYIPNIRVPAAIQAEKESDV